MARALDVTAFSDGVRIAVLVKPRSSKSALGGVHDGALVVRVRAPPVDGAANEELVRTVAKSFGVRRADVCISSGSSSRRKVVEVRGVGVERVLSVAEG